MVKVGLQLIPVVTVSTSASLTDPPSFLFMIINSSSSPPTHFPTPEVSASSSWCLSLSPCSAADTSWFPSDRAQAALTHQKLFSPLGFSSMYSTVLGVFHPVHSLQPQWGHFNMIHFFRITLQTNWASGENIHKESSLICFFRGTAVPSQASELFIWDQRWLKWVLLCQWYALCCPKMIVFGLLFVLHGW